MKKIFPFRVLLLTLSLVISVAALTLFATHNKWLLCAPLVLLTIYLVVFITRITTQYQKNLDFLINATDNGDFSFKFSEIDRGVNYRSINIMLNKIREIIYKARNETVEKEKFLEFVIDNVSTGILITDEKGNVYLANRSALKMLALPVLTHMKQLKTNIPENGNSLRITNERETLNISVEISKMTVRDKRMKIYSLNNIGNELDVNETESWSRLIRVMTHEIMNSTAPISSISETLLNALKRGTETRDMIVDALDAIYTTTKGLTDFIENYRKFTSIPHPEKKPIDLPSLIYSVINIEKSALEGIKTDIQIDPTTYTISADRNQMIQVLINLVKNAIDASYESKHNDAHIIIRSSQNLSNGKIKLEVCNKGEAIPTETLSEIFIPFFTTKKDGSGIGLSLSRYIMQLHGGSLKYRYEDEYTIFSLEL